MARKPRYEEVVEDEVVEEKKPDSIQHHEERIAKMEEEHERIAKETAENQEIANYRGPKLENIESREQLLDHIRKMREAPPPEPEVPVFRSEGLQKEFDAEQAAGRAAVAKAEAEKQKQAAAQAEFEKGEKNKAG